MPRDGSGTYFLPEGYEAETGQTIEASQHNPPLEDIAAALTGSLPVNGTKAMTGDLPMGGNKVTGLGTPTAGNDAATKAYVDSATSFDPANYVATTGDQNISGVKTFQSIPVGPASDPASANQLTRKSYVDAQVATKANDDAVVKLTGSQTIAGVKTFSNSPIFPAGFQSPNSARAFGSFTKSGSTITFSASDAFNVASITHVTTGVSQVNFSTALPTAKYSVCGNGQSLTVAITNRTTSSFHINAFNTATGGAQDSTNGKPLDFQVFGLQE